MVRVAVVTDSSACLPADLLKAHRITTVPLTFLFDGGLQYDGALSGREFYALLRACRRFPTTAAPAPPRRGGALQLPGDVPRLHRPLRRPRRRDRRHPGGGGGRRARCRLPLPPPGRAEHTALPGEERPRTPR